MNKLQTVARILMAAALVAGANLQADAQLKGLMKKAKKAVNFEVPDNKVSEKATEA